MLMGNNVSLTPQAGDSSDKVATTAAAGIVTVVDDEVTVAPSVERS